MRSLVLLCALAACAAPRQDAAWTELTSPTATELRWNGAPVLRTVHDFDPAHQMQTFKVYTHVFGGDGEGPLTKGETTGLFPHHRGIFVGWNRVLFRGKRYDFWHGTNGVGFRLTGRAFQREADGAAQTFEIDWLLADGTRVLHESRTLHVTRAVDATLDILVTSSFLASEPVELDGDPHHAGCHVRLAQEVADREKQTELVLPPTAKRIKTDDESIQNACPWSALVCTVAGRARIVAHFDAPEAPSASVCSARRYGRIGTFASGKLAPDVSLRRRWRIVFATVAARPELATAAGLSALAATGW